MRLKEFLKLSEEVSEVDVPVNIRIELKDKSALHDAAELAIDDPEEAAKLFTEMMHANGSNDVVTLKYNSVTKSFRWVKTHG
jgi:hypothetical protein